MDNNGKIGMDQRQNSLGTPKKVEDQSNKRNYPEYVLSQNPGLCGEPQVIGGIAGSASPA